ncbi:hypothetical protein AB0N92_04145 [Streptomyces sp. NPDC093248]|uniref:hypothetical protein n=1 Tax=Streptomyces sp. NPDC093248 TaxID=3155072 RepID=UPI0034333A8F
MPTRTDYLAMADAAVRRAEKLAERAETFAHGNDPQQAEMYAAASNAWSAEARTCAAIAAVLPADDTTED